MFEDDVSHIGRIVSIPRTPAAGVLATLVLAGLVGIVTGVWCWK